MPVSPFERFSTAPAAHGLYDPSRDRDACGLAMVATLRGTPGHDIVETALNALPLGKPIKRRKVFSPVNHNSLKPNHVADSSLNSARLPNIGV